MLIATTRISGDYHPGTACAVHPTNKRADTPQEDTGGGAEYINGWDREMSSLSICNKTKLS